MLHFRFIHRSKTRQEFITKPDSSRPPKISRLPSAQNIGKSFQHSNYPLNMHSKRHKQGHTCLQPLCWNWRFQLIWNKSLKTFYHSDSWRIINRAIIQKKMVGGKSRTPQTLPIIEAKDRVYSCMEIYRGYYMAARRYEISLRVLKNI